MLDMMTNDSEFQFDVATGASKGKRDYQEDAVICAFPAGQPVGFAILADGMGGHASGDVASALVAAELYCHLKVNQLPIERKSPNIPLILREGAEMANERVKRHIGKDEDSHGMGSTLLSIVITGNELSWLSIGDSPLLLFRDGALRQLNKDHSLAPQIDMMIKTGAMSEEVGKDHPDRSVLTSVINGEEIEAIDCPGNPIVMKQNDILVVASDGVQFLSNAVIANTLMQTHEQESKAIADALLSRIDDLDSPSQDNITFAIIKLGVAQVKKQAKDLEDLPVLALADDDTTTATIDAPGGIPDEPTPAPAPEPETAKTEKKLVTYYYRGRKYTKEE